MTTPRGPGRYAETPPSVTADSVVRAAADQAAEVRVSVTNNAPVPRIIAITALGVDSTWLPRPLRTRPVMPGETIGMSAVIRPAAGTMPAQYPVAFAVQALDPVSENATAATSIANVTLVVDAPGVIDVSIDPADVTTRKGKRIKVRLHNDGVVPELVRLEAQIPETAEIELDHEEIEIGAGETQEVGGKIKIEKRLFGHPNRFGYTISARGSGAARRAEASITTRAFLGASASKVFIITGVVAIWAVAAVVFIPKLSSTIQSAQNKANDRISSIQNSVQNQAQNAQSSVVTKGAPPPAKSGGSSSAPGGKTSSGAAAPGSKPSKTPGTGTVSAAAAAAAALASSVQLNGTVGGATPGGVAVAIAPTSLVDQAAQQAQPVGVQTQSFDEIGKIPESALEITTPSTSTQSRTTQTAQDGAWSFAGVHKPGYYLLTFAKPGYETQRYVIDTASATATQPLQVVLAPGQGHLSGTILGPKGPVGGAQITITDGTNTITTSANSRGAIGTWSVDGLSTPSSYLVSASKDGMTTESQVVSLPAGGTAVVDLTLKLGAGSLVGTVTGPDSLGVVGGIGGAQVTATNGTLTRTATTVTNGAVAGSYTLPDLPPGTYTVTTQAAGYLPVTQAATIKPGQSQARVDAVLTAATATVTGVVTGVQFDTDGSIKKDSSGNPVIGPVDGAGITLTNSQNTYKITSGADGSFRINGVAPGTYTLTTQSFGLNPAIVTVTAVPGQVVEVPSGGLQLPAETTTNSSTITGFVGSAVSPSATLNCPPGSTPGTDCLVRLTLFDSAGGVVQINSDGGTSFASSATVTPSTVGPTGYTLHGENGLAPGLYRLTITSTGFLPSSVNVRVPLNAVATAPQVNLFPGDTVNGTLDAVGDLANDGPAAGRPYTTCVWAIPVGSGASQPTDCTYTAPAPDVSACQTRGVAETGFATVTSKAYSIGNLCDGTYDVWVVTLNPWYIAPGTAAQFTLTHGQTSTYGPHVARKGHVVIALTVIAADGRTTTPTALAGNGNCGGDSFGDLSTISQGSFTIAGVTAGNANVSCTVATTSGLLLTGHVDGLTVNNDQDTPATMTLSHVLDTVVGQVVAAYGNSDTNPVTGLKITFTGVSGYNGSQQQTTTQDITTDATTGCFAITSAGGTSVSTTGTCGTIDAASTNASAMPLVSQSVTYSETGGGGINSSSATISLLPTGQNQLRLTPTPVSFGGQTLTLSGGSVDLSQAVFTVNASGAHGAGAVKVTSDSSGHLTWTDPNSPAGTVWPGTYGLTATITGYSPATATLTCTFDTTTCSMTQFQLSQLGALSGGLIGYQGTDTTFPSVPLVGATVKAVKCDDSTSPATCPNINTTTGLQAVTDTGGNFALGTPSNPNVMALGTWQVRIHAAGYDDFTQNIVIVGGSNQLARQYVTITPVDFQVGIQITPGHLFACPAGSPSGPNCATVALHRVDTGDDRSQSVVTTTSAGPVYDFPGLIPATYVITISGDGLIQTTTQYTVPLNTSGATTESVNVPVPLVQNSVTGSVLGTPLGKSGTPVAVNGVSVELGQMVTDPNTGLSSFQIAIGTDGADLVTQTARNAAGIDGSFAFLNVPNGTYIARYNNGYNKGSLNIPVKDGYLPQISSAFVTVQGGQSASFPTVTLVRVTHDVSLEITPSSSSDNISGAANVQLVNSSDATWTQTPTGPTHTSGKYIWTFPAVPSGSWLINLTLPLGHLGTLTGNPAMTCSSSSPSTSPLVCTMSGAATLTVPGNGNPNNAVTASYALNEYLAGVNVQDIPLTPPPSGDPNVSPPSSVGLRVTDGGGTTVFSDAAITVSSTVPSTPTDSFWGRASTNYTAHAVLTSLPNWQAVDETITALGSLAPVTVTIPLTEVGATVTVNLQGNFDANATVTLTPPSGSGITYSVTPDPQGPSGGSVTFTKVPFGSQWTVTANGTRTVSTTGSTGSPTSQPVSATATFDVTSAQVSVTLTLN